MPHCTITTEAYLLSPASTPTPTGIYKAAIISKIDAALHHIKELREFRKRNKTSLV